MTHLKHIPDKASTSLSVITKRLKKFLPDTGFFILLGTIIFLSGVTCLDFAPKLRLFLAGEISPLEITADRKLFIEDTEATKLRRDQIRKIQPLVCDLDLAPADDFRNEVQTMFIRLNNLENSDELELFRQELSRQTGLAISHDTLNILANTEFQHTIMKQLVPFLQQQLALGVLQNMRDAFPYKGGIVVRNVETGEETLHPEIDTILDIKSLETIISQKLKNISSSPVNRHTICSLITSILRPTLLPNYQATVERNSAIEKSVEPIIHHIERGEVIVRQGEKVTREQQYKIQALLNKQAKRFNLSTFIGISICGILFSTGLLFSPSGRKSSAMDRRDFIFISTLLVIFSLMAKVIYIFGLHLSASSLSFSPEHLAYAMPVAGASALASLIFSTKRYLVTGLLLAFFCTIMLKGGLALFLFYFLSAMWSTSITSRTQSRQDVVWSIIPITFGLIAMWLGSTLLNSGSDGRFIPEIIAVGCGSFFTMILTFALAPIVEMLFGYTTRFRLMELLNMEQPLLRELMLNAPGTYHHALIVANMVEAGAETIGANSLLAKVAALYHDVGKISKANYFIENQFTEDNPHDQLQPSMSVLILVSHVKEGAELGKKHKLGKEVIDIIRQHHGNNLISFFYQKAKKMQNGLPPKVENFCYQEQKPQSKEAALVMLADIIEASSRTLHDPSPTKLQQHIASTIKNIYASGQLDEAELTFKDLNQLADIFQKILRGIFHHRITYPDKLSKNKLTN